MALKHVKLFNEFVLEHTSLQTMTPDQGISKGYDNIKTSVGHGETKGTTTEVEGDPIVKPTFLKKHPNPESIGTDDVQPEHNS